MKIIYKDGTVAECPQDQELHVLRHTAAQKNIRLGPSLPAFLSPNILNYLVENYGIAPITTPDEDIKALMKQ